MVFGDLTAGQSSAAVPQANHKGQTRSCSSVRGTGWEGERGARRFLEAFGRPLVLSGRQARGGLVVVSHGRYPADQSMRVLEASGFIPPYLPTKTKRPPSVDLWLHETGGGLGPPAIARE
jgi:hypothetical protein